MYHNEDGSRKTAVVSFTRDYSRNTSENIITSVPTFDNGANVK